MVVVALINFIVYVVRLWQGQSLEVPFQLTVMSLLFAIHSKEAK